MVLIMMLASTSCLGVQLPTLANSGMRSSNQRALLMKSVRHALNTKDYKEALEKCNQLLAIDPKSVAAHALRSVAERGLQKYQQADRDFQIAQNALNKTAEDWDAVGVAFSDRWKLEWSKSFEAFQMSIEKDPKAAQTYLDRGKFYSLHHEFREAEADFTKAIELDPEFSTAYFQRSRSRQARGAYSAAIADISKAIQLNPIDYFYECRADLYKANNHMKEALEDYNKALSLKRNSDNYAGRASCYMKEGQFAKALPDLDRALSMQPDFLWPKEMKVTALVSLWRGPEALKEMKEIDKIVAKEDPQYTPEQTANLWELRYKAHRANNDWKGSVEALKNLLQLKPNDRQVRSALQHANEMLALQEPPKTNEEKHDQKQPSGSLPKPKVEEHTATFYINRGYGSSLSGRLEAAIDDYQKAMALDAKDPRPYCLRAAAYCEQQKLAQAIADYEHAAQLDATDTEAFFRLERIHESLHQYPEALRDCIRTLQRNPADQFALRTRAQLLVRGGKLQEALKDLDKAVQLHPTDGEVRKARAEIYMKLEEYDKAIPDLTAAIKTETFETSSLATNLYLQRATAYEKLGKKDLAEKDRKSAQGFGDFLFGNAPFQVQNAKSNK
jgi:tetratricopeptide (TPR) repeat protein